MIDFWFEQNGLSEWLTAKGIRETQFNWIKPNWSEFREMKITEQTTKKCTNKQKRLPRMRCGGWNGKKQKINKIMLKDQSNL